MKKIIYPLKAQITGAPVADLHEGLKFLLEKGYFPIDDKIGKQLLNTLDSEVKKTVYGSVTGRLVTMFQEKAGLKPIGEVDEATSRKLNEVLEKLGANGSPTPPDRTLFGGGLTIPPGRTLPDKGIVVPPGRPVSNDKIVTPSPGPKLPDNIIVTPPPGPKLPEVIVTLPPGPKLPDDIIVAPPGRIRIVDGQLIQSDGKPYASGTVRAYHMDEQRVAHLLGETKSDSEGRFSIRYTTMPGPDIVNLRVVVFDASGERIGESETIFKAASRETVNVKVIAAPPLENTTDYEISGKVASRNSAGIDGLLVVIVDKGVGGDVTLAETVTRDGGVYRAIFDSSKLQARRKSSPDLQIRVFTGSTLLGVSEVRYNAETRESLNLQLDETKVSSLEAEHETLTKEIFRHYQGRLAELKETDERQDITYLAHKTGWDARTVAMASLADQFSSSAARLSGVEETEPAFYYALFRAGLPAEASALYQTDTAVVEHIWKQAAKQGVIPARLEKSIPKAVNRFQQLAAKTVLEGKPVIGVSPLKDILSVSLGDDKEKQQKFSEIYVQYRSEPLKLWETVRGSLGEKVEKRLKLDGQLAYLTVNNAQLIRKLHESGQELSDASDLIEKGFYRADQWLKAIGNAPVPPEIPGDTDEERRSRYAELLSAKLRISYPTAVVANMVRSGETVLARKELVGKVSSALAEHNGKFQIGVLSIEQYAVRNGLNMGADVLREITRIQRVYQITPSNEAMNALLQRGVDSAYAVTRYTRDEFVRAFAEEVGGEANAQLIHAKAQQAHNAVLNIAVSYLSAGNAPAIGMQGSGEPLNLAVTRSATTASDVIAYPTLERLFGEMDYCACEHCRSILSPAAYLTDLLLFIDRPSVGLGGINPLDVLLERRPDIQHLPLTCDNTNVAVPYIDLVNETLEYYIVHRQSLEGYTGHSTDGEIDPAELLADPQFVNDKAYRILAGEPAAEIDPIPALPPKSPLPFHRPLELLRLLFDKFGAPLPAVMETMRRNNRLEREDDGGYGLRDILMEELSLSRTEHALLTNRSISLSRLYGYADSFSETNILRDLTNAKSFARRIGISYEDVIELLRTRFINPNSSLLPKLERLGVSIAVLKAFKEGTITEEQFDEALSPHLDASQYGGNVKSWVRNQANYDRIMGLLTLSDPAGSDNICDFGNLEFRYANPNALALRVSRYDFIRISRFIRLWRKLGWTMEQTDKAITALYPSSMQPVVPDDGMNLQRLDEGFLLLLPRLGVLKRVIQTLGLKVDEDLPSLLACFAPIDTHGLSSLYRRMFSGLARTNRDAAFSDDGYGNFPDSSEMLFAHAETLRAAFRLTSDEFSLLVDALGYDEDTPLTLEHATEVFRRGWLARAVKLSVRELLKLTEVTGLDPFASPDTTDTSTAPILNFIDLIQRHREVSLKPGQSLYAIWNQDIDGRQTPKEDSVAQFALRLRTAFAAVDREFSHTEDPDGQTTHSGMALIYGNEAAEQFIGLLNGTTITDVEYGHTEDQLPQATIKAAVGKIAYDGLRKRLIYTGGVMPDTVRDALYISYPGNATFQEAVDDLYRKTRLFFERYPELLPHYEAYSSSTDPAEKKRGRLLAALVPNWKERRKRQAALQAAGIEAKSDAAFSSALLEDPVVIHAAGDTSQPALSDIIAAGDSGLTARFFYRNSAVGDADLTIEAEPGLAYGSAGGRSLPAHPDGEGVISGIWSGYVEVPVTGHYNFRIDTDETAEVKLELNGRTIDLAFASNRWSNSGPVELSAGKLTAITLTAEKVKKNLIVRWETSGTGWETISSSLLIPATVMERLYGTYTRFLRAVTLASSLKLTAAELAFLAAKPEYRISGESWLNRPVVSGASDPTANRVLLKLINGLLLYSRLKSELPVSDERLLTVLQHPQAATSTTDSLLFELTGWDAATLGSVLSRFEMTADDLASLNALSRVYDAFVLFRKLGVPAEALIRAATNEPDAAAVRDLLSALRSRYSEKDWLDVLKPINDHMRAMQRNALVAYVIHQMSLLPSTSHIDTPDKLFEYFLMDVQMEPCMQTSRVRHALSSVQLFIERSLMNLEPRVDPSLIPANQWDWMNRYRVWEANRKVFLYPENWLEPELRDDQSPFFKETMNELLQNDITEERASTALLNYLSKLEEVARLEPCGIHYVENDPDKTEDDIAHVVARTSGANRKYYYRRREYGYWTPWEQIKLDIEDNPVLPVVWKNRLLLFWLKLVKEAPLRKPSVPSGNVSQVDASTLVNSISAKVKVKAILYWSEFYNGKWQPVKTSDVNRPTELGDFPTEGLQAFDRSKLKLSAFENDSQLVILISGQGGSSFTMYNTHSLPTRQEDRPWSPWEIPYYLLEKSRSLDTSGNTLKAIYSRGLAFYPDGILQRPILNNDIPHRTVEPQHPLTQPWTAPFFYEDSRHVFHVRTTERIVTIGEWKGVVVSPIPLKPELQIPSLVLPPLEIEPAPRVLPEQYEFKKPGVTAGDLTAIERFVTEDAYITQGIGTLGTVMFGGREIGPAGVLKVQPAMAYRS